MCRVGPNAPHRAASKTIKVLLYESTGTMEELDLWALLSRSIRNRKESEPVCVCVCHMSLFAFDSFTPVLSISSRAPLCAFVLL